MAGQKLTVNYFDLNAYLGLFSLLTPDLKSKAQRRDYADLFPLCDAALIDTASIPMSSSGSGSGSSRNSEGGDNGATGTREVCIRLRRFLTTEDVEDDEEVSQSKACQTQLTKCIKIRSIFI